MDRIAQLEGQLGAQEEAPVMPNIPTFPIGDDFEIDFSQIPNFGNFLNFGNQMEPFEREDYQDLISEIDNLPSAPPSLQPPPGGFDGKDDGTYRRKIEQALAEGKPIFGNIPTPPPIVQDPNEVVFRGGPAQQFTDLPTDLPLPGSEIDLSKLDQNVAEKVKRSLAAGMPVFQRDNKIIGPSEDRLPPMPPAPVMPPIPSFEDVPERTSQTGDYFKPAPQVIPKVQVPVNLPKINIPQMKKFVPPPVPQAVGSPLIRGNIRDIPTFDLPTTVPRSVIGKLVKGPGI